jgi:putative transposase
MPHIRIWVHTVFGTKNREPFLTEEIRTSVIFHIYKNVKQKNIYIDSINGFSDHFHCLISLGSEQSIANVVHLIKGESSHWINENRLTKMKFEWADEYYAVSVSQSNVDSVKAYIKNQAEHHRKKSYVEECEEFMKKFGFTV